MHHGDVKNKNGISKGFLDRGLNDGKDTQFLHFIHIVLILLIRSNLSAYTVLNVNS